MLFASKIVKHVKSNAIILAKGEVVQGIGAGQMSRVDAVHLACYKAGDRAKGSVMASDAFFPFADGIEMAHEHGIEAVIQPGGSIKDKEVIKRVDELGMVMVTTGVRFSVTSSHPSPIQQTLLRLLKKDFSQETIPEHL